MLFTWVETMELKIIEQKENPFFERKEVKVKIVHHGEATPSKAKVEELLSAKFNVPLEHIIVDYIFSETGIAESFVKAKIYNKPVRKVEKKEEEKAEGSEVKEEAQQETQPQQEVKEGETQA